MKRFATEKIAFCKPAGTPTDSAWMALSLSLIHIYNILILYDRALMDDKAYVSDEEFAQVIARFDGRTEELSLIHI